MTKMISERRRQCFRSVFVCVFHLIKMKRVIIVLLTQIVWLGMNRRLCKTKFKYLHAHTPFLNEAVIRD